jgi:hypothetical protein
MMGQPAAGGCQMVHWGSQLLHLPANSAETSTGASAHELCLNALSTETSIIINLQQSMFYSRSDLAKIGGDRLLLANPSQEEALHQDA